jgi:hypothetical protein
MPTVKYAPSHWFLNRQREDASQDVQRDNDTEHWRPASRRIMQQSRKRAAEHRADSMRRRQKSVICGGVFGAEGIGQRMSGMAI